MVSLGVVTLVFSSNKLVLSNVLFVLSIRRNLLLVYHGYSIALSTESSN